MPRFENSIRRIHNCCLLLITLAGCSAGAGQDWHTKYGWKAEDYFTDPQVISLCKAIEANDLDEIDRLVKAGADVNAKGKDNMTPLLWAFPDNKLERFKKLLEHGADPNVIVESDFNTNGTLHAGQSVTHITAATSFPNYFQEVLEHGGDSGLLNSTSNETLLHVIIRAAPAADKVARIQQVLDRGVELDHISDFDDTAMMTAVSWGGQYEIAMLLLDAGADPKVYQRLWNKRLIHFVAMEERKNRNWNAESKAAYEKLVQRLVEQGESVEEARKDLDRWKEWLLVKTPAQIRVLRENEIAERLTREKVEAENQANEESP